VIGVVEAARLTNKPTSMRGGSHLELARPADGSKIDPFISPPPLRETRSADDVVEGRTPPFCDATPTSFDLLIKGTTAASVGGDRSGLFDA
jgi:hypothetical protein